MFVLINWPHICANFLLPWRLLSLLLWYMFYKLNSFIFYEQCFQTGSDSPTYYHSCIIKHCAFLDMLHCCGAVKFDQCTAILATSWGGEQVNTPAEWRLCQLLCTNIGLPHSRTEIPCRHVVDLSLAYYNGLQSRNFFPKCRHLKYSQSVQSPWNASV